jgi:hypothetical protein
MILIPVKNLENGKLRVSSVLSPQPSPGMPPCSG